MSEFELLLGTTSEPQTAICSALKDMVLAEHEDAFQIVWQTQRIASFGVGPKKMSEHYVYIAPQKAHVNFGFYHGAVLDDPAKLLEGTGKRLRHIKLLQLDQARMPEVKDLLVASIAERRQARSLG